MKNIKKNNPTSPSILNYPNIYYINNFYINPNYINNYINPYYITKKPPKNTTPLHHRLSPSQPL